MTMLLVISPAKTLDFETNSPIISQENPELLKESQKIINEIKKLKSKDVEKLMGVSSKIAELNVQRFEDWKTPFTLNNSKHSIFAFKGDVYTGLQVEDLNKNQLNFTQKHLRILSGLYGVLRPFDLIQAYRLEMGTKFEVSKSKNLYEFWDHKITDNINQALADIKSKYLINLASNEYFKSIQKENLNATIITPIFKDLKNGKYKIISFFAKKARGSMCRYVIQNKVKKTEELKKFNYDGYQFNEDLSKGTDWVFTRDPAQ